MGDDRVGGSADNHDEDDVVASVATGDGPLTYEFEPTADGNALTVHSPPGDRPQSPNGVDDVGHPRLTGSPGMRHLGRH